MKQQRWGQRTRVDDADSGRWIILEAAKACFAEKGIAGTTIDDIAQKASISRRTVYRYFANKTAIIQAAVDEQALAFLRRVEARLKHKGHDFPEFLKNIILHVVTEGPKASGHQLLLGSGNANETRAMYLSSPAIYQYWEELLYPRFCDAQARGEVDPTLDFGPLMAWVGRLVFSFIQFPAEREMLSQLIDRFVLAGLTPSPGTPGPSKSLIGHKRTGTKIKDKGRV